MNNQNYYQLVLINIIDLPKFQDYLSKMAPIVARYGGVGDRGIIPEAIWSEGIEKPDMVNFVHYDNKEAFEQFNQDPAFQKIVHLRNESTRLISFEGYLTLENITTGGETEREYNIEMVNFKKNNPGLYEKYEEIGEGKMKEYGFHVEYKMLPETSSVNIKRPDLIKISYFSTTQQKQLFEKDSMHKSIEQELYPNAIERVIWISGKFRF